MTRYFRDYHMDWLKKFENANEYLEVVLEEYEKDGDTESFLLALRDIAEAQGGISELAKRTNLNRQNLYRTLSSTGNPKLNTILAIIHGLGFKLSVKRAG